MKDLTLVVCKARQVRTVFLAGYYFGILALNYIVDLYRFVFTCCHNKLAFVIEIERCNVGIFMLRKFKSLINLVSKCVVKDRLRSSPTLEGR